MRIHPLLRGIGCRRRSVISTRRWWRITRLRKCATGYRSKSKTEQDAAYNSAIIVTSMVASSAMIMLPLAAMMLLAGMVLFAAIMLLRCLGTRRRRECRDCKQQRTHVSWTEGNVHECFL